MELDNNGPKGAAFKIHRACVKRNTDKVINLINKVTAIDIDKLNQKKTLFQMIKSQDLTIVQALLKIKVDVNIQDEKDSTPLHLAAEFGNPSIVEELLKNGADPNSKYDDLGDTSLHRAINFDKIKVDEKLLDFGVDVDLQSDTLKMSPLHFAVEGNNLTIVKKLLEHKAFVDCQDVNKSTLLHICARVSNIEIAKQLLKKGFSNIVQLLLEYGAYPNAKNIHGHTPLIFAVEEGCYNTTKLLIEHGADVNGSDLLGNVPLHYNGGSIRILKLLIENGACLNINNHNGYSALHWAVDQDLIEYVIVLLQSGASLNVKDQSNRTPIECCFQWKKMDIFRSIIALILK